MGWIVIFNVIIFLSRDYVFIIFEVFIFLTKRHSYNSKRSQTSSKKQKSPKYSLFYWFSEAFSLSNLLFFLFLKSKEITFSHNFVWLTEYLKIICRKLQLSKHGKLIDFCDFVFNFSTVQTKINNVVVYLCPVENMSFFKKCFSPTPPPLDLLILKGIPHFL